jgi:hypothetical protein
LPSDAKREIPGSYAASSSPIARATLPLWEINPTGPIAESRPGEPEVRMRVRDAEAVRAEQ